MPTYPDSKSEIGFPFEDPNFKLAILEDLLCQKHIDLGTPEELAAHVLGREVDFESEGYSLIPECLDFLYRYPLSNSLLEKVKTLKFDGGSDIYVYAFRFWDGDTDEFNVKSIKGIELCPNLTTYADISLNSECDLSRLVTLKALEKIILSLDNNYEGFESLLSLPALKKVSAYSSSLSPEGLFVFDKLRSNGVEVKIHSG